jgi:hypothetical protein
MFAPTSHLREAEIELGEGRVLSAALAVLTGLGIIAISLAVSILGAPGALVLLPV